MQCILDVEAGFYHHCLRISFELSTRLADAAAAAAADDDDEEHCFRYRRQWILQHKISYRTHTTKMAPTI